MAERERNEEKVLIVTERYSTICGGFIDSLRAPLKDLSSADGASMPTTYVTSVERNRDQPEETKGEIKDFNIQMIEPDWKLKYEPSRELLTNYCRDFFSRQIMSISGIQVVVGTEPFTSLTASCLRDELMETYNANSGSSKSWKSSSSILRPQGRPKLVLVNYMEGENSFDDHEGLPGSSELQFIEIARNSDVVISVGLRVYNYWRNILERENVVHKLFIPFESILSDKHPHQNIGEDEGTKAIKRVLTLNTGCDILQSDFHRRVAGILGSLAQMKA